MRGDALTVHAPGLIPMMNRLSQFCALAATLAALSGCGTMSDLCVNLPERRPSIDRGELAGAGKPLYRGGYRTASSRISSGQKIPHSDWRLVIRQDEDHRSSLYGDYVMTQAGSETNVDSSGQQTSAFAFVGAPMPTFSNSRRATDCTMATCPACPHRTDASGCPIGKRASFIMSPTSGHRWW
jgi:hypothetical protein